MENQRKKAAERGRKAIKELKEREYVKEKAKLLEFERKKLAKLQVLADSFNIKQNRTNRPGKSSKASSSSEYTTAKKKLLSNTDKKSQRPRKHSWEDKELDNKSSYLSSSCGECDSQSEGEENVPCREFDSENFSSKCDVPETNTQVSTPEKDNGVKRNLISHIYEKGLNSHLKPDRRMVDIIETNNISVSEVDYIEAKLMKPYDEIRSKIDKILNANDNKENGSLQPSSSNDQFQSIEIFQDEDNKVKCADFRKGGFKSTASVASLESDPSKVSDCGQSSDLPQGRNTNLPDIAYIRNHLLSREDKSSIKGFSEVTSDEMKSIRGAIQHARLNSPITTMHFTIQSERDAVYAQSRNPCFVSNNLSVPTPVWTKCSYNDKSAKASNECCSTCPVACCPNICRPSGNNANSEKISSLPNPRESRYISTCPAFNSITKKENFIICKEQSGFPIDGTCLPTCKGICSNNPPLSGFNNFHGRKALPTYLQPYDAYFAGTRPIDMSIRELGVRRQFGQSGQEASKKHGKKGKNLQKKKHCQCKNGECDDICLETQAVLKMTKTDDCECQALMEELKESTKEDHISPHISRKKQSRKPGTSNSEGKGKTLYSKNLPSTTKKKPQVVVHPKKVKKTKGQSGEGDKQSETVAIDSITNVVVEEDIVDFGPQEISKQRTTLAAEKAKAAEKQKQNEENETKTLLKMGSKIDQGSSLKGRRNNFESEKSNTHTQTEEKAFKTTQNTKQLSGAPFANPGNSTFANKMRLKLKEYKAKKKARKHLRDSFVEVDISDFEFFENLSTSSSTDSNVTELDNFNEKVDVIRKLSSVEDTQNTDQKHRRFNTPEKFNHYLKEIVDAKKAAKALKMLQAKSGPQVTRKALPDDATVTSVIFPDICEIDFDLHKSKDDLMLRTPGRKLGLQNDLIDEFSEGESFVESHKKNIQPAIDTNYEKLASELGKSEKNDKLVVIEKNIDQTIDKTPSKLSKHRLSKITSEKSKKPSVSSQVQTSGYGEDTRKVDAKTSTLFRDKSSSDKLGQKSSLSHKAKDELKSVSTQTSINVKFNRDDENKEAEYVSGIKYAENSASSYGSAIEIRASKDDILKATIATSPASTTKNTPAVTTKVSPAISTKGSCDLIVQNGRISLDEAASKSDNLRRNSAQKSSTQYPSKQVSRRTLQRGGSSIPDKSWTHYLEKAGYQSSKRPSTTENLGVCDRLLKSFGHLSDRSHDQLERSIGEQPVKETGGQWVEGEGEEGTDDALSRQVEGEGRWEEKFDGARRWIEVGVPRRQVNIGGRWMVESSRKKTWVEDAPKRWEEGGRTWITEDELIRMVDSNDREGSDGTRIRVKEGVPKKQSESEGKLVGESDRTRLWVEVADRKSILINEGVPRSQVEAEGRWVKKADGTMIRIEVSVPSRQVKIGSRWVEQDNGTSTLLEGDRRSDEDRNRRWLEGTGSRRGVEEESMPFQKEDDIRTYTEEDDRLFDEGGKSGRFEDCKSRELVEGRTCGGSWEDNEDEKVTFVEEGGKWIDKRSHVKWSEETRKCVEGKLVENEDGTRSFVWVDEDGKKRWSEVGGTRRESEAGHWSEEVCGLKKCIQESRGVEKVKVDDKTISKQGQRSEKERGLENEDKLEKEVKSRGGEIKDQDRKYIPISEYLRTRKSIGYDSEDSDSVYINTMKKHDEMTEVEDKTCFPCMRTRSQYSLRSYTPSRECIEQKAQECNANMSSNSYDDEDFTIPKQKYFNCDPKPECCNYGMCSGIMKKKSITSCRQTRKKVDNICTNLKRIKKVNGDLNLNPKKTVLICRKIVLDSQVAQNMSNKMKYVTYVHRKKGDKVRDHQQSPTIETDVTDMETEVGKTDYTTDDYEIVIKLNKDIDGKTVDSPKSFLKDGESSVSTVYMSPPNANSPRNLTLLTKISQFVSVLSQQLAKDLSENDISNLAVLLTQLLKEAGQKEAKSSVPNEINGSDYSTVEQPSLKNCQPSKMDPRLKLYVDQLLKMSRYNLNDYSVSSVSSVSISSSIINVESNHPEKNISNPDHQLKQIHKGQIHSDKKTVGCVQINQKPNLSNNNWNTYLDGKHISTNDYGKASLSQGKLIEIQRLLKELTKCIKKDPEKNNDLHRKVQYEPSVDFNNPSLPKNLIKEKKKANDVSVGEGKVADTKYSNISQKTSYKPQKTASQVVNNVLELANYIEKHLNENSSQSSINAVNNNNVKSSPNNIDIVIKHRIKHERDRTLVTDILSKDTVKNEQKPIASEGRSKAPFTPLLSDIPKPTFTAPTVETLSNNSEYSSSVNSSTDEFMDVRHKLKNLRKPYLKNDKRESCSDASESDYDHVREICKSNGKNISLFTATLNTLKPRPPPTLTKKFNTYKSDDIKPHELSTIIEYDTLLGDANLSSRILEQITPTKNQSIKTENSPLTTTACKFDKNKLENKTLKGFVDAVVSESPQSSLGMSHSILQNLQYLKPSRADATIKQNNNIDTLDFRDLSMRPFVTFEEYIAQSNMSIHKIDSSILGTSTSVTDLHSDREFSTESTLPDIVVELIKRNVISKPFSSPSSDDLLTSDKSPEFNKSSFSLSYKNNGNNSMNKFLDDNSLSSSISLSRHFPDLEDTLKTLGFSWAIPTLQKTEESIAISTSTLSDRSVPHVCNKENQGTGTEGRPSAGLISLIESITKTETAPGRNKESYTSIKDELQILSKEIEAVKNNVKHDSDLERMPEAIGSLFRDQIGSTDINYFTSLLSDHDGQTTPRADLDENRASERTLKRTSTPVELFKSSTFKEVTKSIDNISQSLFSNVSDLSSVKVKSTNETNGSDHDDLTIPNISLRFKSNYDTSPSSTSSL